MQPKRVAFTDEESKKLGEYLDKFAAAGPLYTLDDETFRSVQVLIARKIWELRPDIASAIQEVANPKEPPALLIENVPIDDPPAMTPNTVEVAATPQHALRSDYFNAGVGLIRYGDIVPISSLYQRNIVNEPHRVKLGTVPGRRMHRDIYYDHPDSSKKSGDLALHVQRENKLAATPLIGIGDIPQPLLERMKQTHLIRNEAAEPILQEREGALRFHPHFTTERIIGDLDDKETGEQFFRWMEKKALADPLILYNRNFLLVYQSRAFHGATDHEVIYPLEEDRWVRHTRFEILDGSRYAPVHQGIYPMPHDINEAEVLQRITQLKTSRPITQTR